MDLNLECGATRVCTAYFILICINDLEEGVTSKITKCAYATKLFRQAKEIGDKQKLQYDIDKLVRWSENGRCY